MMGLWNRKNKKDRGEDSQPMEAHLGIRVYDKTISDVIVLRFQSVDFDTMGYKIEHHSFPHTVPIPRRHLAESLRRYADHLEDIARSLDNNE